MSYKFSQKSIERLHTCDVFLVDIMQEALMRSAIDFGIAEGYRTPERQRQLFDEGKSKIDGISKRGKHNFNPSRAVDIYAWVNGKVCYDKHALCFLAGVILSRAKELSVPLRWGGNWDMDGEIITDQTFQDLVHFELI